MPEAIDIKEQIYIEYKRKITGYIRSRISNPQETEDLVSCVFLKIYQKLDSFDGTKASLSTWLYTITRNTVTDYFRTKKVEYEYNDEIFCNMESDGESLNDSVLEDLSVALEMLNERERDLIILRYYNGYTLVKIAEMMKMSYANTKIIHNKALTAIKKHMTTVNK